MLLSGIINWLPLLNGYASRGGLSGYRTNHSLRATAATRMYDKGVDEQLICEKTGKSYKYVDIYSRLFIVLIV